jgi:signal peptidase I
MFGDRVVISDGKFYPISKEANEENNNNNNNNNLRVLIFSCGTRQVPPKDASEVSTASYQPDAIAKFKALYKRFIPEMGSAGL